MFKNLDLLSREQIDYLLKEIIKKVADIQTTNNKGESFTIKYWELRKLIVELDIIEEYIRNTDKYLKELQND